MYNSVLVEIKEEIPDELYDILEGRKLTTQSKDKRIRERNLANLCPPRRN